MEARVSCPPHDTKTSKTRTRFYTSIGVRQSIFRILPGSNIKSTIVRPSSLHWVSLKLAREDSLWEGLFSSGPTESCWHIHFSTPKRKKVQPLDRGKRKTA